VDNATEEKPAKPYVILHINGTRHEISKLVTICFTAIVVFLFVMLVIAGNRGSW
jgi:hypothetical protein